MHYFSNQPFLRPSLRNADTLNDYITLYNVLQVTGRREL